ncbi:hypothetical protein RND71_037015 [Anisodus tanguticus]|uniref:Uncharacterized protein n=1 Tax=Anisodus tanguticus TaxID=243964 RepID=A0AAE1R2P1_9SOLA|nr:hypothetical protein RND71_037015 [Anisodus tanguticus]
MKLHLREETQRDKNRKGKSSVVDEPAEEGTGTEDQVPHEKKGRSYPQRNKKNVKKFEDEEAEEAPPLPSPQEKRKSKNCFIQYKGNYEQITLFNSKYTFHTRPTPLAPKHAPATGLSSPAFAANSPLPPFKENISPPALSLPFVAEIPPVFNTGGGGQAAAPVTRVHNNGLWCIAKPSVPPETLQEALDYPCGEGDADCEAISLLEAVISMILL